MKAREYREMGSDELADKLEEQKKHLFELRSQAVTEKLENSRAIVNVRRNIARMMTVIRQHKQ